MIFFTLFYFINREIAIDFEKSDDTYLDINGCGRACKKKIDDGIYLTDSGFAYSIPFGF